MSISSSRHLQELSPEVLEILKKVAEQVATKGDAFEQKLLQSQANNPQYEFLLPTSKHHDYYLKVLHQEVINKAYKQAGLPTLDKQEEKKEKRKTSSLTVKPAKLKRVPAKAPPPFTYAIDTPPKITLLELEQMRLTAMFAAKYGISFVDALPEAMKKNPLFGFLDPSNTRHFYYLSLIQEYDSCMNPTPETLKRVQLESTDRQAILRRVRQRSEWEVYDEERRLTEAAAATAESAGITDTATAIDWHDFVVVENITFDDLVEHQAETAPPTSSSQQGVSSQAQLDALSAQIDAASAAGVSADAYLGPTSSSAQTAPTAPSGGDEDVDVEMEIEDEDATSRSSSRASASRSATAAASLRYMRCPICHNMIPEGEIAEHIRVEQRTQQTHQQQLTAMRKAKVVASAEGHEVTRSLNAFYESRPDLYQTSSSTPSSSAANAAKAAAAWDGRASTKGLAMQQAQALQSDNLSKPQKSLPAADGDEDMEMDDDYVPHRTLPPDLRPP